MRRTIILAAALAIILLGLWGTAVIYFDEARLKGVVSDRLSEQLGRRVEIVGVLRFSLFPSPRVDAEEVVVFGPDGSQGPATMTAESVRMGLRFMPLLQGELSPAEMRLSGAVIDLNGFGDGGGEGGADPLSAIRSSAGFLAGRSLRLDDVTFVLSSSEEDRLQTIAIDFVEFDRFSLDRTVAFRFRGNLGDPPVLNDLRADGLLHVPASPSAAVRLREMRVQGSLAALDQSFSLTGELTATSDDPFRLALVGGRFTLGESSYDLSVNYYGGQTPSADVLLSGRELDWFGFSAMFGSSLNLDLSAALVAVSQRVDLRSQLQFKRLLVGPMHFSEARVDLRSQSSGLGLNLAAVFPGGLAEASGVLAAGGSNSLAGDAIIAELGQLLDSLGLPTIAGGSGEARFSLEWPSESGASFLLEGQLGLWDGYWRVGRDGSEPQRSEFDRFTGEIRLIPGYLEMPQFDLSGGELAGVGWAAIAWPQGDLGGEIRLGDGEAMSVLELSGTLSQPRLTSPAAEDDDSVAAEDDEAVSEELESDQ